MKSLFLALCLLFCCLAPVRAAGSLSAALDRVLDAPALRGGITGAIVCRVSDGRVLYAHNPDTRLLPASNRKLFTSAAALELLGDDYRLQTELRAAQKADANGVLTGDLFLCGGGDGLLSLDDLDAMAQTLQKAGVRKITGNVVGDGSMFTDGPYGFGWEWDDFSDEEFPQLSGLEANEGVLGVHVASGKAVGELVQASLVPPVDYLPLEVQAQTVARGDPKTVDVSRVWDQNVFQVTGHLPLGTALDQNVPVKDPPRLAATLLRDALMRHGILVSGRTMMGKTPPEAFVVLASHTSAPLAQYIARMNKPSDNLLAESLVRVLGHVRGKGGSYDAGDAVEVPFFQSLGVDMTSIRLVDGCGVGRRNFVTARAVAQLLLGMRRKADWKVYYDSLPIAGVDGTLQTRFKNTRASGNVHAKTGTLSQVRALSGYFTGRGGGLYVFSLLMNNFPGTAHEAGTVQDKFVESLVDTLP
ncbi:MAG: D-alanyl-D-alanine carboxypeptidase/D-alanyl-D-alanine-endopeptidase [Armatimonadota bacterium]|nr:D-alanyl-D-alanine carboxypeptidase/D-alanyl-D-alanine-endopeptidase [Armatimonadota bacterium]